MLSKVLSVIVDDRTMQIRKWLSVSALKDLD